GREAGRRSRQARRPAGPGQTIRRADEGMKGQGMGAEETLRERFVAGETDRVRLGGYGGTVNIVADGTRIRLTTTRPKARERVYPDTPDMREAVYELGEKVLAAVRGTRRTTRIP